MVESSARAVRIDLSAKRPDNFTKAGVSPAPGISLVAAGKIGKKVRGGSIGQKLTVTNPITPGPGRYSTNLISSNSGKFKVGTSKRGNNWDE